jgi:hypothetical protein
MKPIRTCYTTASGVDADFAAAVCEAVTRADFFGAVFWTATLVAAFLTVFFAAFAGAVFNAAFLTPAFLAATGFGLAVAAFFAAHRFFKAATIAALPALLSLRLGFGASGVAGAGGADSPRIFAHRRCWASFIRFRAAAENFFRLRVGASGVVAGVGFVPPSSMAWSSAIWRSILVFCDSNPVMAAMMISFVSFVGMSTFRNHSR